MKSQTHFVFFAVLLVLSAVTAGAADKPPEAQIRSASCLVKVSCDPAIVPLNIETFESLLKSSGIAGKAGREVLNVSREEAAKFIEALPLLPENALSKLLGEGVVTPMGLPTLLGSEETDDEEASRHLRRARSIIMSTRQAQIPSLPTVADEPVLWFRLEVRLPEDVKPMAKEFLIAVTDKLQTTLTNAYETYMVLLERQVAKAESERNQAQAQLSAATADAVGQTAADAAIEKQLEQIVDLSNLNPDMPFGEAIQQLRNSVDPPLQINVPWGDLYDNADIDRETPINMDPISQVQLKTALKLLLEAVGGGFAELGYTIDGGAIRVATRESLPDSLEKLLQTIQAEIPMEDTLQRRQELLRDMQVREMDIARKRAKVSAIENQIKQTEAEIRARLEADAVGDEIRGIIDLQRQELERIKRQVEGGRASTEELQEAQERLARARIELAERRDQLGKSAGAGRIANLNDRLADLMIDLAVQEATQGQVGGQLRQAEEQLAATSDPKVSQVRFARQAYELTENRLKDLQRRLAGLGPPIVAVLGVE